MFVLADPESGQEEIRDARDRALLILKGDLKAFDLWMPIEHRFAFFETSHETRWELSYDTPLSTGVDHYPTNGVFHLTLSINHWKEDARVEIVNKLRRTGGVVLELVSFAETDSVEALFEKEREDVFNKMRLFIAEHYGVHPRDIHVELIDPSELPPGTSGPSGDSPKGPSLDHTGAPSGQVTSAQPNRTSPPRKDKKGYC